MSPAPDKQPAPRRSRLLGVALALLLPLVVAGAARLTGARAIFTPTGTRLVDTDSYHATHRMLQARAVFPARPPSFDPLLGHPDGQLEHWPPGLAYLGGGLARLTGAVGPDQVARLGTLLVVALGALGALLAAALTLRFARARWAALGGLALALWPLHIEYSRIGRVDHHVLEPLLTSLAALLYFAGVHGATPRARRAALIGCGLALGAAIWSWPSALLPVGLLGAGMLAHQLALRTGPAALLAFAVSLLAAAPLCLDPAYRRDWTLHAPSPLHLVVLGAIALASLWLALGERLLARRGPSTLGRRVLLLVLLAALLAPLLLVLPAREALRLAVAFGGRRDLWELIHEQRPIWLLATQDILLLVTYLGLALPALVALALRAPLPVTRRRELLLLTAWAGVFMLLGCAQVRFLPLGLALAAPLAALGVAELARRLRVLLEGHARQGLIRLVGPALAVGAVCLHWPAVDYLVDGRQLPSEERLGMEDAARWLRTRPAGERPTAGGEGVLAPLAAGHVLVLLGEAPVVGTMLVTPATEAANRDALTFFATGDLAEAQAIVERRRIGWVALRSARHAAYHRILRYLGRGASLLESEQSHRATVGVRLSHDLGAGRVRRGQRLAAVSWLQHRWESYPVNGVDPCHLFRVVRGALITGNATPGALVTLELPLVSNRGRPFAYRDVRRADRQGAFSFRLPYPTASGPPAVVVAYKAALLRLAAALRRGERKLKPLPPLDLPATIPTGPARLRWPGWRTEVQVAAREVTAGATVGVPAPAPDPAPASSPASAPVRPEDPPEEESASATD